MNIVIAEGSTAHNIGSMALIDNAIKIARTLDSKCNLTILSSEKVSVYQTLSKKYDMSNIQVIDDLFLFPDGSTFHKVCWLLRTSIWILMIRFFLLFSSNPHKMIIGRRKQLLHEISKSDYVFCIGAERINDIYYKTAYLSLEALDIYTKMKAKLIHLSLTIGPIFNKTTINKAAHVLNNSYGILVRDQKSFDLLEKLKVKKPYRFNSFDVAILQDKMDDTQGSELIKNLGLPESYVCCSIIDWLFRKCKGPVRMPEYNKAVAEALDYIIEKYDIDIVLTPTVVGTYKVDDVQAGYNMMNFMKHKDRVHPIKKLLTPSELSYVFSRSKFSIVTRMHAAILCTGAGNRPIIAINYLYKLREYMKNIGFEDYSVDIDYVTSQELIKFIDNMFNNYDENQMNLTRRMHKMQETLLSDVKEISQKK